MTIFTDAGTTYSKIITIDEEGSKSGGYER